MNYIVFDIEATCWENPPPGYVQETIEIGAFRINDFGEIRGRFNRFIRPQVHPQLSIFCKELTNISQASVNRAKYFPEVIEEFQDWARVGEESYILLSWGNFDKRLLMENCRLHRLDDAWVSPHVNLKEAYHIMKRLKNTIGLKKAVEMEGIIFTGQPHRGISDAENLTKLFLKYLGAWEM